MFFSPLQETPHLGRNPVYWAAIFLFTLFQAPILKPTNLTCLLIFRFLTGFVGSPILATGGASMADLFSPRHLPYAMGVWAVGAVCGPILGASCLSFYLSLHFVRDFAPCMRPQRRTRESEKLTLLSLVIRSGRRKFRRNEQRLALADLRAALDVGLWSHRLRGSPSRLSRRRLTRS